MAEATWRCPSCDTYNEAAVARCMVCDEQRTRHRPPENGSPGRTWQCRHCDVWNDAPHTSCQGCQMGREAAPKTAGTGAAAGTWPRRLPGDPVAPSEPARPPRRESAPSMPRFEPRWPPGPPEGTAGPGGAGTPFGEPERIFFSPKPGAPHAVPYRPAGKKRTSPGLVIGLAVAALVALVIMVGAIHSPGGGSGTYTGGSNGGTGSAGPTPTDGGSDSGEGQAQAVDQLLSETASTRSGLRAAVDEILDCSDVSGGISTLSSIAGDRQAQLDKANGLEVGAISGGDDMKSELVRALKDSLSADRSFLSWAQAAQSAGCDSTATITDDFREGERHSKAAGRAKTAFVDLWNPIASSYSLDDRSDDDI